MWRLQEKEYTTQLQSGQTLSLWAHEWVCGEAPTADTRRELEAQGCCVHPLEVQFPGLFFNVA